MKKKRIGILCALGTLIFLGVCGCSSQKEKVKLKSETEIIKYASEKYGKANYVSKESNSNLIKYTLQDNEYKFNYECSSSVSQFCIDASCTESYYETTTCNFEENYKKYILDTLNLDNVYQEFYQNLPSNSSTSNFIFAVTYENEKIAKENIPKIAQKFKQIDNRKYFNDYNIAIYDSNNTYLGVYNTTTSKFIDKYEEAVNSMTYAFATEVNHNSSNLDGITYLYYKRIQYKDVEKLQIEWLSKKNVTIYDWTTAYYFKYNGNIYFMLDDKVFINDKTILNRYIADKYYTNYWFTE